MESFSSSKAPHQQLVNDLKSDKRHQQKLSLSLSRTAPAPSTKGQIRIGLCHCFYAVVIAEVIKVIQIYGVERITVAAK